jgi:pimeloyl-ACP methyl ester carboxylesterase
MTGQALDLLVDNIQYLNAPLPQFNVFYREAGDPSGPTILLLHGFPTSSHMFRSLVPALALYMHVIAPDLPGFGLTTESQSASAATDGTGFKYTFDNLAVVVEELIIYLGITNFFLYAMDYGAPTGFRLMAARPERILGLIVQNGNAYEEGLTDAWVNIRRYWKERTPEVEALIRPMFTLDFTRKQYVFGAKDETKISPDNWINDYYFLQQVGKDRIQLNLFYDYQNNLKLYPEWQKAFRKYQFPTLIVWGKNDFLFGPLGATAFKRDLPHAKLHFLDGGHFVLEEYLAPIANYIIKFVEEVTKHERY